MKIKKQLIVFLDFDGVLHYFDPKRAFSNKDNAHFAMNKFFERAVVEIQKEIDIKIVISSSWREAYSLEELKSNFSNNIQPLIIDILPLLENTDYFRNQEKLPSYTRELEASLWLKSHPEYIYWIAVDDVKEIWNTYSNVLILDKGFNINVVNTFKSLCRKIISKETAENEKT